MARYAMEFMGLCIMTGDVTRLANFYRALFETTSEGNDAHATLTIGGLGLAIWREGLVSAEDEARLTGLRRHCYALMFSSPDLDATYQRALALGAGIQEPPAEQPWGCRACVLNDPDGNRVDVVERT